MASRKHYIERVKKGMEVYKAMESLKDNESMLIEFGNRGQFKISVHEYDYPSGRSERMYAISDKDIFGKSMNIDMKKSGKSFLYCYSYDLFGNGTSAKLYFEHITIVEPEEKSE